MVMGAGHLLENRPRKNRRPIEARQAQLAGARIKAVMLLVAVGREDQPGRARFIVEPDGRRNLVGQLRNGLLRQAEGASSESFALALDLDAARLLHPVRPEERS